MVNETGVTVETRGCEAFLELNEKHAQFSDLGRTYPRHESTKRLYFLLRPPAYMSEVVCLYVLI